MKTKWLRPRYQLTFAVLAVAIGAFVQFGAVLDGIGNAAQLISPAISIVGILLTAAVWLLAEFRTRKTGVLWLLGSQPIVVRRLGGVARAAFAGVGLVFVVPWLIPSLDDCSRRYLRIELRADGYLNGNGIRRTDGRYGGARYYEFLLGNPTSRCTAVVDSVILDVLDSAPNFVERLEATTAVYEYTVPIAADTRGPRLVTDRSFNYPPGASPELFRINVVPVEWGFDSAIRFRVLWHDLASGKKFHSSTCTMVARFPRRPTAAERSFLTPEFLERTRSRVDAWPSRFDMRGCAQLSEQ